MDLNVLHDVITGKGVGDNSCRRGREILSSVLGERIDLRGRDFGRLGCCLIGDMKSIGAPIMSRIRGRREE